MNRVVQAPRDEVVTERDVEFLGAAVGRDALVGPPVHRALIDAAALEDADSGSTSVDRIPERSLVGALEVVIQYVLSSVSASHAASANPSVAPT
ncbi:hypothetical protein C477_16935 [Haloterrigena salina JCM 13891]|uniref:Uncharacterized protein n=1 Tax=Haloterrigena salina JCM 13891 TaxID=1227488 RepID=M0BZ79_9EURY|nr:hypothetical protein C477_16935 [Haloterrigena salina JCM 13891]